MESQQAMYYCVGVRFGNSETTYSYRCPDTSVRVGDAVLVPVSGNRQLTATVVSAAFCTAETMPFPLKMIKSVIRKCYPEEKEKQIRQLVSVLRAEVVRREEREKQKQAEAAAQEKKKLAESAAQEKKKLAESRIVNPVGAFLLSLRLAPVVWLFMLFLFCGVTADIMEYALPIFFLAFIMTFLFLYIAFSGMNTEETGSSAETVKRRKGTGGGGRCSDSGWYPHCPEEDLYPFADDFFDLNGDGEIDSIESSIGYDMFFGDE